MYGFLEMVGRFIQAPQKELRLVMVAGVLVAFSGCFQIVWGQNSGVLGAITRKDGAAKSSAGVNEAEVIILRMNPRGKWALKSDKSGNFVQHGLTPYKQYYFIVSGANCMTEIRGPISLGSTVLTLNIELKPGDGHRPTDSEIEALLAGGGGSTEPVKTEMAKVVPEKGESKGNFEEMKKHLDNGVNLANQKKYEEAVAAFKQAGEADGGYFEIYQNLGTAYSHNAMELLVTGSKNRDAAKKAAAKQGYQDSASALDRAIALAQVDARGQGPKAVPLLKLQRAEVLIRLGEFFNDTEAADKAIPLFQEVVVGLTNQKDRSKCLVGLGKAFRFANKLEYAAETLRGVLKSDPACLDAAFELARVLTVQDPEMKDVVLQQEALSLYAKVAEKSSDPQVKAEAGAVASFLKDTLKSSATAADAGKK